MNEINFLPQSFLESQNRRLRLFREVAILCGMVLIGLALFAGQSGVVMSVQKLVAQKQDELDAAKLRSNAVADLNTAQQQLKLKLALHEGLAMPLNPSTILAAISQMLPDRMALTEVTFSADDPKPDLSAFMPKKKDPSGMDAEKIKVVKPQPRFMNVQLMGISPTDVDVANLVGSLSASPLFQNVKMRYSKSTRLGNVTAREFRLEMEILLDCIYQDVTPRDPQNKEVAHVD